MMPEYPELIAIIKKRPFYIYGNGIFAYNVFIALQTIENIQPEGFLVTEMDKQLSWAVPLNQFSKEVEFLKQKNAVVLIATPEVYHEQIIAYMKQFQFEDYICVDYKLEYDILKRFFCNTGFYTFEQLRKMKVSNRKQMPDNANSHQIGVFMARSSKDQSLKKHYDIPIWVKPIQAGAALSRQRIADIADNTGNQISRLNSNFCELTATYWIWKNTNYQIKGLFHYRRMLVVTDEMLSSLTDKEIDVILPFPFVCPNKTSDQFGRYISSTDEAFLLQAIQEMVPEDYDQICKICEGKFIYNYNMLVARAEVFDDYCNWIFPILMRTEELCNPQNNRNDRHAGYLGEVLTSIYFLLNQRSWKIIHAPKRWMV